MSKKPKGRKRLQHAAVATPSSESTGISSSAEISDALSKAKKRKLQKKRAKLAAIAERQAEHDARVAKKAERVAASTSSVPHPVPQQLKFYAVDDDHCETAPEAYAHIAPILSSLAAHLRKTSATLRVYDRE